MERKLVTRNYGDLHDSIYLLNIIVKLIRINLDSAECIIYSTDYYLWLTLESWFTKLNLEQTPLSQC